MWVCQTFERCATRPLCVRFEQRSITEASTLQEVPHFHEGSVRLHKLPRLQKKGSKRLDADDVAHVGCIALTVLNHGKTTAGSGKLCYRCGDCDHTADTCRFRQLVCHECCKLGHIAWVCWNNKSLVVLKPPRLNQGRTERTDSGGQEKSMFCQESKCWMSQFRNNHYLKMEHFLYSQCTARVGNWSRLLCRWTDTHWRSCVNSPFNHLQQAFSDISFDWSPLQFTFHLTQETQLQRSLWVMTSNANSWPCMWWKEVDLVCWGGTGCNRLG